MHICFCLLAFLFIGGSTIKAQELSSFVEYGTSVHAGDNTPLWQASNQQGLSSLANSTYIRGGVLYKHGSGKWKFGGYKTGGSEAGDLGNSWKDYIRMFFPGHGSKSGPIGEHIAFQGNFLGSEYIKMTYRHKKNFSISAYLDNHFDDFSGMGKLNGWDGLWGIEYKSDHSQAINSLVVEYLQTTNMSGPLHGLQDSPVKKTGGADNYYNNGYYPGWVHWEMGIANPLIASPIYNKDGDMSFKYNRVKALHLGWSGGIGKEWKYIAKLSYNKTFGTPNRPIPQILENFSTFASFYYIPRKWKDWSFNASLAFDTGEIYGNNIGFQLKVYKTL